MTRATGPATAGPTAERRPTAAMIGGAGSAVAVLVASWLMAPKVTPSSADIHRSLWFALLGIPLLSLFVAGVGAQVQRTLTHPAELVVTEIAEGFPATVIRGRSSLSWAALVGAVVSVCAFVGSLTAWPNVALALVLLILGCYSAVGSWILATGGIGEGNIVVTRSGITQRLGGWEQSIHWNSMIVLRPHPEGFAIGTTKPVTRRRTAPRLFCAQVDVDPGEFVVRLANHHPGIDVAGALVAWAENLATRAEIGSPLAAERLLGTPVFADVEAAAPTTEAGSDASTDTAAFGY